MVFRYFLDSLPSLLSPNGGFYDIYIYIYIIYMIHIYVIYIYMVYGCIRGYTGVYGGTPLKGFFKVRGSSRSCRIHSS